METRTGFLVFHGGERAAVVPAIRVTKPRLRCINYKETFVNDVKLPREVYARRDVRWNVPIARLLGSIESNETIGGSPGNYQPKDKRRFDRPRGSGRKNCGTD